MRCWCCWRWHGWCGWCVFGVIDVARVDRVAVVVDFAVAVALALVTIIAAVDGGVSGASYQNIVMIYYCLRFIRLQMSIREV